MAKGKNKKKQKKVPSPVALHSFIGRPGGTHDRRQKPRRVERDKAIQENS